MNKLFFIAVLLFTTFEFQAKFDPERPFSIPTHQLSKTQGLIRNVLDFWFEEFGYQALRKENEDFIKGIINDLDMNDYTIEIRGMSYLAQTKVGHINAFASGLKFFAYIYVSEEWFDTLALEEKEALIRHELMHIRKNHLVKKVAFGVLIGGLIEFIKGFFDKIQEGKTLKKNWLRTQVNIFGEPQEINFINYISKLVTLMIIAKYSRITEKEADIEAAKTMQNKQGFITFLTNFANNRDENRISKFKFKQSILDFFEPIIALFRTHPPCKERIDYIKEIL